MNASPRQIVAFRTAIAGVIGLAAWVGTPPLLLAADEPVALAPTSQPADQVQALLSAHQFSQAVRLASKTLGTGSLASDNPGAAVDRFRILMLKGQGFLGMHENYMALDSFRAAGQATKDPRDKALVDCTVELVQHANGSNYVPKFAPPDSSAGTPKAPPISLADVNLLDADQRKPLFNARLDDRLTAMQPRIQNAAKAQSLYAIYPVLEEVEKLAQLDTVANGDADKTASIAHDLLDHARGMLSTSLKQMWTRMNDIEQYANQVTNYGSSYPPNSVNGSQPTFMTTGIVKRNGLSETNKQELTNMIATCGKIHQAADAFGAVARAGDAVNDAAPPGAGGGAMVPLGTSNGVGGSAANGPSVGLSGPSAGGGEWAALGSDADRLAGHAKDVLDTNFDTGSTAYSTQINDPTYPGQTGTTVLPNGQVILPNGQVVNPPATTPPTNTSSSNTSSHSSNSNTKSR